MVGAFLAYGMRKEGINRDNSRLRAFEMTAIRRTSLTSFASLISLISFRPPISTITTRPLPYEGNHQKGQTLLLLVGISRWYVHSHTLSIFNVVSYYNQKDGQSILIIHGCYHCLSNFRVKYFSRNSVNGSHQLQDHSMQSVRTILPNLPTNHQSLVSTYSPEA